LTLRRVGDLAGEVAAGLDVLQVIMALVRAVMPVHDVGRGLVHQELAGEADGPAKPTSAPVTCGRPRAARKTSPTPSARASLISFTSSSPAHDDHRDRVSGDVEQALEEALGRRPEERAHLFDGALLRRVDLLGRGRLVGSP